MVNLRKYLKSVTPAYWDAKAEARLAAFERERKAKEVWEKLEHMRRAGIFITPINPSSGVQPSAFGQRKD